MKIPRGFSEELRNQADILKIVGDYVSLKKKGNNYWACCPFHNEKTPSFSVNPSKGLFKCFGCGKGGDAITFVMEIEGAPFPEAVKTVAEKCGIAVPVVADDQRDYEERDRQRADLLQLNAWATEFFEQNLTETAEGRRGLAYLEGRGITEATQKQFRLGYAPNSWDAMSSFLRSRGASTAQIERSGLVTLKEAGGFYDRFRGRLMFPICDTQGRPVAFGGRIIGEGEPKYLNSPETAVYTKGQHLFGLGYSRDSIRNKDFAILVEGYLDFLIPFQEGVRNLVASLGTALTDNQVRLLGRYTRKIVVNFDPDSAGVAATKRSLELLLGEGFKVNVLTLPDNLDPDEFIRERGADGYLRLLKNSQPFLDYIVEQAVGANDQTRPTGKVETINAILPYLKLVKDRIERAEQFERIADRLKIDSKLIRQEFRKAAESRQDKVSDHAALASVAVKPAERKLLEILLACQPVRRQMSLKMTEEDYFGLRTEKLFHLIFEFERQQNELSYPALSQLLGDTELASNLLPQLMISNAEIDLSNQEALNRAEREATESLHTLRYERVETKRLSVHADLKLAQQRGDEHLVSKLSMEHFELLKRERELARHNG
ncbi:MAG TPA: DNA primase [Blastocatellia bacterium]|nr:DNA primase [Blastocatellia bacterium]